MVVAGTAPSAPSTPTRRAIAVAAATVAVGWGCISNSSSAGGDGIMYCVVAAHTVVARAIVAHAVVVRVVARVVVERTAGRRLVARFGSRLGLKAPRVGRAAAVLPAR